MNKNVITAVVGSLCALLLCEPHSLGQTPLSSLEVTGTATLNILNVNGPAALNALTVSGTTDLLGNSLFFGSWLNNLDQHGVSLLYTDGTSAASPARLTFSATRPSHEWLWEREKSDQTGTVPMMKLDASHVLTIYNTAGTAAIVLDPSSPSSPTAVLTQQAADSRYVSSANFTATTVTSSWLGDLGPSTALMGGTATGIYSFAGIGSEASGDWSTASGACSTASADESTASGVYSRASGYESTASGAYSTASGGNATASGGNAIASGYYSTASGYYSTASGDYSTASNIFSKASAGESTASGAHSTASGVGSTASGFRSTASGFGSTAMGYWTTAQGFLQTVVGVNNLSQGNALAWVPTDDLFVVGNGTKPNDGWSNSLKDANGNVLPDQASNALVVKKNGNTTVYGALTVSAPNGSTATTPSGFSIAYNDGTSGTNSAITLQSSRPSTAWNWQRGTASGTAANVMQIDASNRLILTGTAATNPPQLILDPNGSVTMSGINLLTQTAADALYLSSSVGLSASNGNIGIGTTTPTAMLDVGGNLKVGADASASGAQVQINPKNAGTVGQTIKGFTSQTASLQEWQNSSGNTLASIKIGSGGTPAYDYGMLSLASAENTAATANIYVSEDTNYQSVMALYITPPAGGRRIFFGDATHYGTYVDFTNMRTIIASPTIYLTTASFASTNNVGTALHPTWSASILRGSQNSSGIMLYPGNWTASILGDMGGEGMSSLPFLVDTRDGHGYQRGAGYLFGNMENYSAYSLPHTAWYVNGTESSQLMALQMTGELDVFVHKPSAKGLAIKGATSQTGDLTQWQDASGTALSVVNKNGWMGIGTATPQAALDVNGNANISGNLTVAGTGSLTLPGGIILSGSNTLSSVITSSTAAYAMASTTAVALSGAIQAAQVNGLSSVATTGAFASLQSHPTTLAGYGITDPVLLSTGAYTDPAWLTSLAYAKLTNAPTNISAFANDMGYITASGTASNLALSGMTKVSGGLVVTGTTVAVVSGTTTTTKIVASGTNQLVLIPEQGDLSMGNFTSGVQPQ